MESPAAQWLSSRFRSVEHGQPAGSPVEVHTGFVKENGDAMGRPVGVAIDRKGALLVADDVGNTVRRVFAASSGIR